MSYLYFSKYYLLDIVKADIKNVNDQQNNREQEKKFISNDYLKRKSEAAQNKARDRGSNLVSLYNFKILINQYFRFNFFFILKFYKPPINPPVKINAQDNYLETLNKVRLQNLNRKIDNKVFYYT
jgi:hypothetical protein